MARRSTTERVEIPAATAEFIRLRCHDLVLACMHDPNIIDSLVLSCYHQGLADSLQVFEQSAELRAIVTHAPAH
jgi:hypothetical protein